MPARVTVTVTGMMMKLGALLDTLRKLHTFGGTGHIAVFNTRAHKALSEQRVPSFPFAVS